MVPKSCARLPAARGVFGTLCPGGAAATAALLTLSFLDRETHELESRLMVGRRSAEKDGDRTPAFSRHGDAALYAAGALMIGAGVILENQAAVKTVLVLVGAGLVLVGVLLPRVTGTIEMGPQGIKIPIAVVARLEATRLEAEQKAPERVSEAVGKAYQALLPLIASGDDLHFAIRTPSTPARSSSIRPPGQRITCPKCGHENEGWQQFCGSCGAFLEWAGQHVKPPGSPSEQPMLEGPPPPAVNSHVAVKPDHPRASPKGRAARRGNLVICAECGYGNDRGRHFCSRCGEALNREPAPSHSTWWRRLLPRKLKPTTAREAARSASSGQTEELPEESPQDFAARIVEAVVAESPPDRTGRDG